MRGERQLTPREDTSRSDDRRDCDLARASILRHARIHFRCSSRRRSSALIWMMTLTFGRFSFLYAWVDGAFVGFCAEMVFIPATDHATAPHAAHSLFC